MIVVLFTIKHDKWKVFIPAIFTMMGMHVMSVGLGTLFPLLFSRNVIVYFSVVLFVFFGVKMIYEAYNMKPKSAEEKVKEIQNDIMSRKVPTEQPVSLSDLPHPSTELGIEKHPEEKRLVEEPKHSAKSPYLHLVGLLFVADWGDRCQISAIVLTATYNPWGVAAGGALVAFVIV
eukprot:TRINITY_DN10508_c0_g5_i2.p1 TRINITY_DN10508_c0_g5~~TRINITY_DN10508_c0_g5_i2.p1  ORF type:complete len:175 (-),score=47.98 TRINITY_DN10508_c0_g5_i2:329-853(-)